MIQVRYTYCDFHLTTRRECLAMFTPVTPTFVSRTVQTTIYKIPNLLVRMEEGPFPYQESLYYLRT